MGTITVKGTGHASAKPDYVILKMEMNTLHKDYEKAMKNAGKNTEDLNKALEKAGFEKGDLKTTHFSVNTQYETIKDKNDQYHRVFEGYNIRHHFSLGFDFSSKKLAKALGAIASSISEPDLSIQFTVKDQEALKRSLLENAAVNARENAVTLCRASQAELGELVSITYNWTEIDIYSRTRLDCDYGVQALAAAPAEVDIEPEDVEVEDSVTFVWEVKNKA